MTKDLLFETEEHGKKFAELLFQEVVDECHKIGMEAQSLFEGKSSEDGSKTAQNLYQMIKGEIDPQKVLSQSQNIGNHIVEYI